MNQVTPILVSFPNWFYGLLSFGIIGFVFYLGSLHTQVKRICSGFPKVEEALTRISEILLQKRLAKDLVFSRSPINLTEEGMKALADAGFEEFYQANQVELLERVQKHNPKTMADVEEACKSVMLSLESTIPKFGLFKDYSYKNGQPILNILFAASVALRDRVAEELKIIA